MEDATNIKTFNTAGTLVDDITINQGRYFQRCSSPDLTGWLVVTDKPAAVIGGTECTSAGNGTSACDHLDEQLIPIEALASSYVSCPTLTRPVGCDPTNPATCAEDIFRYVATEDSTTITTSPNVGGGTINEGQFLEITTDIPHIVTGDKPFSGHQVLVSQNSGSPQAGTGDPALLGIPPVEQFQFNYLFLTPNTYAFDFINVVAPVGTTITLDGTELTDTCRSVGFIGGTEYCCFGKQVVDGVHSISGDQQFGLSVTGFDSFASYGYIGGVGLQPLNAGCDTGGPYLAEECDAPFDLQLDGTPSCSDGSDPTVLWSSDDGVTFDDATIANPLATVPEFGTFEVCMEVTCEGADPVTCCSTITLNEQTVGCNLPPVTNCKSPTVNTDPGQCSASVDCGDIASCSDPDGDPTTLSCDPSGPYPVGTTFVEATCDDGEESTSAFCSVAVVDNEAPVINCPANVTLSADGACQALYAGPSATATDNCGAPVITSSPSLPAILGGLGNHTIDYTATDAAGNNSSCTQTIMVIDVTPPVVQCELTPLLPPPGDDDDDDDGGLDGNTQVNFSAVDNCSVPDLSAVLDIGCKQIDVSNGQIIDLECDDDCEVEAGDDDDDDDAGVSILEIEAQSVELIVTATDGSGNVGTCTTGNVCPPAGDDDDD